MLAAFNANKRYQRVGFGGTYASHPLVNSMPCLNLDCEPKPMSKRAETSVAVQGRGEGAAGEDDGGGSAADDDDGDDGDAGGV